MAIHRFRYCGRPLPAEVELRRHLPGCFNANYPLPRS